MKVLGKTKTRIFYGRQPGPAKPVKVVSYDRKKGFGGKPNWLGEYPDWARARAFLQGVRGIELE